MYIYLHISYITHLYVYLYILYTPYYIYYYSFFGLSLKEKNQEQRRNNVFYSENGDKERAGDHQNLYKIRKVFHDRDLRPSSCW